MTLTFPAGCDSGDVDRQKLGLGRGRGQRENAGIRRQDDSDFKRRVEVGGRERVAHLEAIACRLREFVDGGLVQVGLCRIHVRGDDEDDERDARGGGGDDGGDKSRRRRRERVSLWGRNCRVAGTGAEAGMRIRVDLMRTGFFSKVGISLIIPVKKRPPKF